MSDSMARTSTRPTGSCSRTGRARTPKSPRSRELRHRAPGRLHRRAGARRHLRSVWPPAAKGPVLPPYFGRRPRTSFGRPTTNVGPGRMDPTQLPFRARQDGDRRAPASSFRRRGARLKMATLDFNAPSAEERAAMRPPQGRNHPPDQREVLAELGIDGAAEPGRAHLDHRRAGHRQEQQRGRRDRRAATGRRDLVARADTREGRGAGRRTTPACASPDSMRPV